MWQYSRFAETKIFVLRDATRPMSQRSIVDVIPFYMRCQSAFTWVVGCRLYADSIRHPSHPHPSQRSVPVDPEPIPVERGKVPREKPGLRERPNSPQRPTCQRVSPPFPANGHRYSPPCKILYRSRGYRYRRIYYPLRYHSFSSLQ